MKNFLFIIILFIFSNSIYAQPTVTVTNSTNCDITYIICARDVNSPPGCFNKMTTVNALANSTGTTVIPLSSYTWSGPAPIIIGLALNAYVVDDDPSLTSCIVPPGYFVGNTTCGYTNSISLPSCSCSGTNTVFVDWAQTGAIAWSLDVHY